MLRAAASIEEDTSDKLWISKEVRSDKKLINFIRVRRRQLRALMSVDDLVARLIGRLRELGELRNTLIIFTSDNGEVWGEHLLGGKRWPYDEALRVPMLMRWDAGNLSAGSLRSDVVANIDIAPTIYDATGVHPLYTVDGKSLLSGHERRRILIEFRHDQDTEEVPRYQEVWSPGKVFVHYPYTGRYEFYAASDPYQLHNLYASGEAPDPAPYLARIEAWSSCSGSRCP